MATTRTSVEQKSDTLQTNGVAVTRDERDDYSEDREGCEYVGGVWVEKKMGAVASHVAMNLFPLQAFIRERKLGLILDGDTGYYRIFPGEPKRVRKPDRSFIRSGRLPADTLPAGYIDIAPDLAIEVVSPNDEYGEVQQKKLDYLAAGVRLVWIIDPPSRSVSVVRPDRTGKELIEGDELDGDDVVTGFRMKVADLFVGL